MNLAELAIKRPVFITSLVILLLTVGAIALKKLPVDLFPKVSFPVLLVNTTLPGASPEEVETLVTKVIEDAINNIPGIKQLSSENTEGRSQVVAEFTAETDIKYAEQQIRDKISAIKRKLPESTEDSNIKRIDPADRPILILALKSSLPRMKLFEMADKVIKPKLEQLNEVGMVETLGGSGREIRVELDPNQLRAKDISVSEVANRIGSSGENVPIGKIDQGMKEKLFRSLGGYDNITDIGSVVVKFLGNDVPVTVNSLGKVLDTAADRHSRTYVNGKNALLLMLYRQTGTNTIAVATSVKKKLADINHSLSIAHLPIEVSVVRDGSKMIKDNVDDVVESILIGITLTIVVVYLFLGTARSTFITGLALPTSLLGSFFLMHLAGFSINTMSLLALSLAVGLLVDDAIVVRENIFRHASMGYSAKEAAIKGTKEVLLAVIATSLTVIAVFGPIGFLHGIVGGFFKEFGLTVCFAMIISLFDAITIAPMLSAYIGLKGEASKPNRVVAFFNQLQTSLEQGYRKVLSVTLRFPKSFLLGALIIFIGSILLARFIPKTFVPPQDTGEFMVSLEMPPGSNLLAMDNLTQQISQTLQHHAEIATCVAIAGSRGEPNRAQFFIQMVPSKLRKVNTTQFKQIVRTELKRMKKAKVVVTDVDLVGGGGSPRALNLDITGDNLKALQQTAMQIFTKLKLNPNILDLEISYKLGKPEMQIIADKNKLQQLGVSATALGQELRFQVEGATPAVYRENGQQYDIRVRLKENQRDLEQHFASTLIPNINGLLVKLSDVAKPVQAFAPATISRKDRQRYIRISGDIAPQGPGLGGVMTQIQQLLTTEIKLPPGVSYDFEGEARDFSELIQNMVIAVGLGILFIYLVLASLYESFITPLTIMLVLPLAACGALYGLLLTQHSLDIFSMIGCILLFGIATKNSILLVDYTKQLTAKGIALKEAIIQAGLTRLRPILMTTIALIAGMLPVAIGINEASKQRTSMGIAIIGGLITSTLLTLVVVPAAYAYIEGLRSWFLKLLRRKRKEVAVIDCDEELTDAPS